MAEKEQAKKLSFWKLIQETEIEMPIIQRDYAQGRDDKKKVRDRFLQELKACATRNVELDFIYGKTFQRTPGNRNKLHPLDGQQRLTTLFLLHWYAAQKDNMLDADNKRILSGFTYQTRISSRDFCLNLIKYSVGFTPQTEKLSAEIKDTHWFVSMWNSDQTIYGMLNMLDAIHQEFRDIENLWEILTSDDRISFYSIDLEHFGLTDDLYIKMNARGKQLSAYENFKAGIEKKIIEEDWEKGIDLDKSFSYLSDVKWTDKFWDNRDPKQFDQAWERFVTASLIITRVYSARPSAETQADREKYIQNLRSSPENIDSEDVSKEEFEELYKLLNLYLENQDAFDFFELRHWSLFLNTIGTDFFNIICNQRATFNQHVLFHAHNHFLLNKTRGNADAYKDWMRVVRNIIMNQTVDRADSFSGAIRLVNELAPGCNDIYTYLNTTQIKSAFAERHMKEEMSKAALINVKTHLKTLIQELEDTDFCRGHITFALYCADFDATSLSVDEQKLKATLNVFNTHFAADDIDNSLRRALLTCGNHKFYHYWDGSVPVINATKRSLIQNTAELRSLSVTEQFRDYLKELTLLLTNKTPDKITKDFIPPAGFPQWKSKLIKEPKWLDNIAKTQYIGITENEKNAFVLKQKRPREVENCVEIK